MIIGIGGAGGKLASIISDDSLAINVSASELQKNDCKQKVMAYASSQKGHLQGSKKNPKIGRLAYQSIKEQVQSLIAGNIIVASSGGGTGNGILSCILDEISSYESIDELNKSQFIIVLPYAKMEANEYVVNTIDFLQNSLSFALDSTNTGNIFLVSNQVKFEGRLSEKDYNLMIAKSFKEFYQIAEKADKYPLLEGHIDQEDFKSYLSKSFFNHFAIFDYDENQDFASQVKDNKLLLQKDKPIEALFLLELPANSSQNCFYDILDYFQEMKVQPIYSVLENDSLTKARITVSYLYARKPIDLVNDYYKLAEANTELKIQRSLEQEEEFEKVAINMQPSQVAQNSGKDQDAIISVLKRLGKL